MPLKVPFAASLIFGNNDIAGLLAGSQLCAYKSAHTPANSDVAATYTAIEATFSGYARITLSVWSAAVLDGANRASVSSAVRTWTASGAGLPQSIHGIFVLDGAGNCQRDWPGRGREQ